MNLMKILESLDLHFSTNDLMINQILKTTLF